MKLKGYSPVLVCRKGDFPWFVEWSPKRASGAKSTAKSKPSPFL